MIKEEGWTLKHIPKYYRFYTEYLSEFTLSWGVEKIKGVDEFPHLLDSDKKCMKIIVSKENLSNAPIADI